MKKAARRSKKKATSKPKPVNNTKCTLRTEDQSNEQQPDSQPSTITQPRPKQQQQDWTPIQIEQAQLAKKLDRYITEFQKKQLRLNFAPSDRELVILFIMNLHPRFKRFVEPVELSCSNWIEAAAFARHNCTRISAILGCERHDSDPMFKSPEARALIDSGYFVSSNSPSASMYPGAEAIKHLLLPNTVTPKQVLSNGNKSVAENLASKSSTAVVVTKEDIPEEEKDKNNEQSSSPGLHTGLSGSEKNAEEIIYKEEDEKEPGAAAAAEAKTTTSDSPSPITKSAVQARIQQAVKTKKEKGKEREKKFSLPRVAAVESNGSLTNSKSICYRVPEEHSGVNLTFLELTINGKKVKGLLAKVRWGSSAMSLDCVRRLGLTMTETDDFCIYTDFGYEDTIGIVKLPINHPADPSLKSDIEIQVLPLIYGGKIDLVLGADFFYFFNPTLNIKTRAIRFLDKETPYIVSKIE